MRYGGFLLTGDLVDTFYWLPDHVKGVYKDGTASKDAASLAKRLAGWDVTPTEVQPLSMVAQQATVSAWAET